MSNDGEIPVMDLPALGAEIISPEGVEERLVFETGIRITLTGGGKYRVYSIGSTGTHSHNVYDNWAEAYTYAVKGLGIVSCMLFDPEGTIAEMLKTGKKD